MPLDLCAAGTADAERIIAFWAHAGEGTDRHDSAAAVRALIERDPGALILAVDGDRLLGTLIAGWDGWRCHLYRLAVHPEHRRQGIAGRLLAEAERRFVALGGQRADAMVLTANASAHPAWQAAGYAVQEQWRRWVKPLPPGLPPA